MAREAGSTQLTAHDLNQLARSFSRKDHIIYVPCVRDAGLFGPRFDRPIGFA
jgi:hypothetical protein